MKFLKGFIITILSIILFSLMLVFAVDLTVKNIIEDQMTFKYIKDSLVKEYGNNLSNDFEKNYESIVASNDTEHLFDSILKEYKGYHDNNYVSPELVDEIIEYIKTHEHDIEGITNEDIKIEDIDNAEVRNEITKGLEEMYSDINSDDGENITVALDIYLFATSKRVLMTMVIIMLFIAFLIALIKSSNYKWMKPVGITSIVASVFVISLYQGIKFIIDISNLENININSNITLIIGAIYLVLGIALIIIKHNIDNQIKTSTDISEN